VYTIPGLADNDFANRHDFAPHWFHFLELVIGLRGQPLPRHLQQTIILVNIQTTQAQHWQNVSPMTLLFLFLAVLSTPTGSQVDASTVLAFAINGQLHYCLSLATPSEDRFMPASNQCGIVEKASIHSKHTVTTDPLDTTERIDWFHDVQHVQAWRRSLTAVCSLSSSLKGTAPQAVLYQRDAGRLLRNINSVAKRLVDMDVRIIQHDEGRSPCSLAQQIAQADVVITPHGFNTMVGLFQGPGTLLVEVYPYFYYKIVRLLSTPIEQNPWTDLVNTGVLSNASTLRAALHARVEPRSSPLV
jgi:hypothetical protein